MSKLLHEQRRKLQKRGRKTASLNLVSLMDIFTILVFFLMVNSSEVDVIQTNSKIKLPDSTSEQRPENRIVISVSGPMLSCTSPPEQKLPPAPVNTTALTVSNNLASSPGCPAAAIQFADNLMSPMLLIAAAAMFVTASPTAMRPDAGAFSAARGVRSPIAMASPVWPAKPLAVIATSLTGTCQGPIN